MRTVTHTLLYPYVIYPSINFTLSASIYMTVVLGLERFVWLRDGVQGRGAGSGCRVGVRVGRVLKFLLIEFPY
jgi:hypothetical protein